MDNSGLDSHGAASGERRFASKGEIVPAAPGPSLPLTYTEACRAVAECWRVDECKGWADKAAAVAAYAKMVRNVQLEVDAKRIRLRATRRIGEIIGGHFDYGRVGWGRKLNEDESQLSVGLREKSRAIARIPKEDFENMVGLPNPPSPSLAARASQRKCTLEKTRNLTNLHKSQAKKTSYFEKRIGEIIGSHMLLDFIINRQPARNLPVGEVIDWARRYHSVSGAFLLLLENHDRERRVGDCVDEAMADQALAACKKVDSI